jgi:superfamily II DNA or RNA helicase
MTAKLRPYQRQAIDAIRQDWQDGYTDVLLTAATGSGKTVMFLQLLDELLHDGQRALILSHRRELVYQPYERLGQFWAHRQQHAGIVMGQSNEAWAQIVIATVQSLQGEHRLRQILSSGPIDYLIVDEAHHSISDGYGNVIHTLKDVNPNLRHLGVTATPLRADGKGLAAVYQKESAHFGIQELVRMGHLAPPRWLAIQTGISLADIRSHGSGADRDFNQRQLANVYETANCFDLVVASHQKYAADRQSVAFTVSVDGAHELADTFNRAGIAAVAADGNTPQDARNHMLSDFRAGKYQVLCNAALWVEGLDLPEISCVHQVRPTRSDGLYAQIVGRALRLFPGKTDALILDYAPLDSRNLTMLGDVLGVEAKKQAYIADKQARGEVVGGLTFDGDVKWLEGNPMEIVSRRLDYLNVTPWRWSQPFGKIGPMVLGLGPGEDGTDRTLVISSPAEQMDVWLVAKREDERRYRAYHVLTGTFEECSEWANDYADQRGNAVLARKQAYWRDSEPSEGQVKFARRLGVYQDDMTKGEVADAITCKLALGALNRKGVAA